MPNTPAQNIANFARPSFPPWMVFVLMVLVLHVLFAMSAPRDLMGGRLLDPDSYTRLNRVLHLFETGDWYSTIYPRSNAPYGEVLHWTRPLDLILLVGAWMAGPFVSFRVGLHWWGVLLSPILHGIAMMGMIWLGRSLFDRERLLFIAGLFLLQPGLLAYFLLGRPDHHSFLLASFVWLLGFTFFLLVKPFQKGLCYGAGAVAALAIWVSVESMVAMLVCLTVMAGFWVFLGQDFSKKLVTLSGVMCLVLTLALFVERWGAMIFLEEYDRFSIVYWTITVLIAGFWVVVHTLERRTKCCQVPLSRFTLLLFGSLVASGVMWVLFPKIFQGPLVDVDPRMIELHWNRVLETQPLINPDSWRFGRFFFYLGLSIPAVPILIWLIGNEADKTKRSLWVLLGVGSLVFVPLALWESRWAPYAEVLLVIPYAIWVVRILRGFDKMMTFRLKAVVIVPLVLLLTFGPFFVGGMVLNAEQEGIQVVNDTKCPLLPMAKYLNDPAGQGAQPRTIMTYIDFGPELLYRTPHRMIATPSHRNSQGLVDTFRVMNAVSDEEAHQIIRSRQVDFILLCPNFAEQNFYEGLTHQASWYQKIKDGDIPSWGKQVDLPTHLKNHFQMVKVIR